MGKRISKLLCMLLSITTFILVLPLSVSAACAHTYTRVYTEENEEMHSYLSKCTKCGTETMGWGYSDWLNHEYDSSGICIYCGYQYVCTHADTTRTYQYENDDMHSYYALCNSCGEKVMGWGYSDWEDHTYSGNSCTQCGFIRSCSHSSTSIEYSNVSDVEHSYWTHCNSCGIDYYYETTSHVWNYGDWIAVSDISHERMGACVCGADCSENDSHSFSENTCSTCGYTETDSPSIAASVSLSASGPSGTLGAAGGEIASESYPASYTVFAESNGCTVTHIVYTLNDRTYISEGTSVTITANTQNEFQTSTFTAYTDVSGVTTTFTVNFKYVRKSQAYVMWETSDEAVIRSITGNGLNISLAYSMTVPNSYDTQGNLTDEQVATIQGLIGRNDGLTYMVNYTRTIRVYTPADYSSTGEKQYHATYDGNDSSAIAECLSKWGWTTNTQAAIQQAAASSLSFTTGLLTDCTAIWIDTSTDNQLYSKTFGEGTVTPSQSIIVSVSYSEYTGAGNYVYESLTYTGDASGSSASRTYSQTYTVNSKPLTVTFYCHPEGTDENPSEKTGSITVIVRDAETYVAITDAYVWGTAGSATTDSVGAVTFSDLPMGDYVFTAEEVGYISGSGQGSITEESPDETIVIYLAREIESILTTGNVTVYVRDANTNAYIADASIRGDGYGTTNNSGYKTFSNLSFGTYSFTATKNGYSTGSGSAVISTETTSTSLTIYLTPLPTSGTITVYVKDASTGAAISGASVSDGVHSGSTNSSGYASFRSLPFGDYIFSASKLGYSSNSGSVSINALASTNSVTIYLTEKNVDVGILAEAVDGTVYRGSTIMVSADVYGDAAIDFAPDNPLTVTMKATRNGGTVFDTQTKSVICPKGDTNLVWFTVNIPETGYTSADVTFTFTVITPATITDTASTNDVSSKTVTTYVRSARNTPDASFEQDSPADFTHSTYKTNNNKQLSWTVWEWNGGFVEKTYSARLTVKAELTPDATAVWSKYNNTKKLWTTRSGYGLNTAVTVSLTGVDDDMFAGNAKVNAYYPEFNYSISTNKSNALLLEDENESGYTADFTFDNNTDTISGNKMHVTPVWFPDGEYSVKYEVYDIWTPAGMLTANTYAIINIEGSLYDDYYTQRN